MSLHAMDELRKSLSAKPKLFLITGVAGFIGSHLLEELLGLGVKVKGIDNFSTGFKENLEQVRKKVGPQNWGCFEFFEGDVRDFEFVKNTLTGVDVVLHQAALGSVPRSIEDPSTTDAVNVGGFVNVLNASRLAKVKRLVYASSSSVYGDSPELPKSEDKIGKPLSPYAVSKVAGELYAGMFSSVYGLEVIGLRYFNVFGPRQNPKGAYAAVIPRWIGELLAGQRCSIFGDGETSRDFCYIKNVVQANLLAALTEKSEALGQVYNIAQGGRTTLKELHQKIVALLKERKRLQEDQLPHYEPFRVGDVRHSLADITKARRLLGYDVLASVDQGLIATVDSFLLR